MRRKNAKSPGRADTAPSSDNPARGRLRSAAARPTPAKVNPGADDARWSPPQLAAPAGQVRSEFADLFDFVPATYAVVDDAGRIVRISTAAARLLNVERERVIGQPLESFVVPEDRHEWVDHLRRCRGSGNVVESEIRFVSRHTARLTCRVHTRRMWFDGHEWYPCLIVDRSELRAVEEARLAAERRKDRAEREVAVALAAVEGKDQLIAAVSHELRAPLAPALIAAGQLTKWAELPDMARHLASTIKRNIEMQARLIDDLLDVARVRDNRLDLQLELVDVHQVLLDAIQICSSQAESKHLLITRRFTAGSHFASADVSRLRQVFWNLLNNAFKFSANNGEVVVTTANSSDATITVEIRDDGSGMSSLVMAQLFNAFHPTTRKESRSGLGLGLMISKGIVDAHSGRLWGTSEGPGLGSTFGVELTTVPATQLAIQSGVGHDDAMVDGDPEGSPPKRVLLIEDDADSSEMLALSLTDAGFIVEVAATLAEGLAKLDEAWDVVMSDLRLPDGSGLDIARRARRLNQPPGKLVALTGWGAHDDYEASREAGFDLHLVKPVDLERLVRIVAFEPFAREV